MHRQSAALRLALSAVLPVVLVVYAVWSGARGAGPGELYVIWNSAQPQTFRTVVDTVCRDNPPLECSVCLNELPVCVRVRMRVGVCGYLLHDRNVPNKLYKSCIRMERFAKPYQ